VFPNEKREFSEGWTKGRAGVLHERAGRRAAEKGRLQKRAALWPALFRSPA